LRCSVSGSLDHALTSPVPDPSRSELGKKSEVRLRLSVIGDGRSGSFRRAPFSATIASNRAGPQNKASRSLRIRPVTSTAKSPACRAS
jgi:hypothetical protein